jgi:hypothetical protein
MEIARAPRPNRAYRAPESQKTGESWRDGPGEHDEERSEVVSSQPGELLVDFNPRIGAQFRLFETVDPKSPCRFAHLGSERVLESFVLYKPVSHESAE